MKNISAQKSVKVLLVLIAALAVAVLIYLLLSSYMFNKKAKMGTMFIDSKVDEYKWSKDDTFNVDDYPSITAENGKLKIFAITDTHLESMGFYANNHWLKHFEIKKAYSDIKKLIDASSPDLILVTGDVTTDPLSDKVFQQFADFMDDFGIPWTVTFGNHDSEWRASREVLSNILLNSENCIFQTGPTNIQGLGNFILNVKNPEGKIFYSVILMDSGDWQKIKETKNTFNNVVLDKTNRRFSTTQVGISDKQTEWYEWVVNGLKKYNNNKTVETMAVFHIPLTANNFAVRLADKSDYLYNGAPFSADGEDYYQSLLSADEIKTADKSSCLNAYNDYKSNYKFYNSVLKSGSTKNIISGHNHCQGYAVKFDGIIFTSVVKTDDIYTETEWDNGLRGGTEFVISEVMVDNSHLTGNSPLYIDTVTDN